MRYFAFACDYDGTIAKDGRVNDSTVAALRRVRQSGRKVILVTGRKLDDLLAIFPPYEVFDRIVAENGAVLYNPAKREENVLAEPPSPKLLEALRKRNVASLDSGKCIVSTWTPYETAALDAVRETGLELQVSFNKGAVMILPSGVNKKSGLTAALKDLKLSVHNAVGVGDAENDYPFLTACEFSAAVANALETLKGRVDIVTQGHHGAGVEELIEELLATDLTKYRARDEHRIRLGFDQDGNEICLSAYGSRVLVTGPSGSGKSTIVTAILERLAKAEYQFCVVDPEGDYNGLGEAVTLGDHERPPVADEALQILEKFENLVVDFVSTSVSNRQAFAEQLVKKALELQNRTGRPHWIVLDEAHQMFPPAGDANPEARSQEFGSEILVTVHPQHVSQTALAGVNVAIAVGSSSDKTLGEFSKANGGPAPAVPDGGVKEPEVLVWFCKESPGPIRVRVEPAATERRRHRRNYAAGDLQDKSFYFRGPEGKLNLRAQNLATFVQMAEGVDDDTWMYHLRRGDYSQWMRAAIKDEVLAARVEEAERADLNPSESRARIKETIEKLYTGPA